MAAFNRFSVCRREWSEEILWFYTVGADTTIAAVRNFSEKYFSSEPKASINKTSKDDNPHRT